MKTRFIASALALSAASLFAGPSMADVYNGNHNFYPGVSQVNPSLSLTKQQVQTELAAAARSGDLLAAGDTGLKVREIRSGTATAANAGASRGQVERGLMEAIRTGDYSTGGEIGGKCNELHPSMHAAR